VWEKERNGKTLFALFSRTSAKNLRQSELSIFFLYSNNLGSISSTFTPQCWVQIEWEGLFGVQQIWWVAQIFKIQKSAQFQAEKCLWNWMGFFLQCAANKNWRNRNWREKIGLNISIKLFSLFSELFWPREKITPFC